MAPPGAFIAGTIMLPLTILEKKNSVVEIDALFLDAETIHSLTDNNRHFIIDHSIYIVCKEEELLLLRFQLQQKFNLVSYQRRRQIYNLLTSLH